MVCIYCFLPVESVSRCKSVPLSIHRGGVSDHLPGQTEAEQEVGGQQQHFGGVSGAAAPTGCLLLHRPWKHPEAPAPPPNCHLCYQGNVEVHASSEMPSLKYEHRPVFALGRSWEMSIAVFAAACWRVFRRPQTATRLDWHGDISSRIKLSL